ncbi:universal stress protein [Rhodobacter sp. NTK016B]|uniref:universal stress protein n=1 Tax=Rhodobacter sp. NTK016B TaxID=2759676 RepID=UPI001A8EAE47|nr:universal stress protein [Rhodobacter sp. NTK016B]MBN8290757.1 universal stress protein [Rhodobacter sp. NTK016B]
MTTPPIVVAYDGSGAGERAVTLAQTFAESSGAALIVAHVLEWSPYSFLTKEEIEERHKRRKEEMTRAEQALVSPVVAKLQAAGLSVSSDIRFGHVAETLVEIAKASNASQIVIGRIGSSGLGARLFGSVTGTLAQIATVPVTIVP